MAKLIWFLERVVIAMMAVVTLAVIAEIVTRTFANFSLIFTDELSRYLMVWTALLGAVLLVHEDGHVRIAVVENMLGQRGAFALFVISQVVGLGFFAVVIISSLIMLPTLAEQNTVTLGISIVWFYLALPITSALMSALIVRNTVRRFHGNDAPIPGGRSQ
jgi:TRAP-type C4-dicarboxylate transport system permease small subunit